MTNPPYQQPPDQQRKEDSMAWAVQVLQQAKVRNYYGKIIVVLKAGAVEKIVREDSLKPPP